MVTDQEFYASFIDFVIGVDTDPEDEGNRSHGIKFLMHQYEMIPTEHRDLFWNICRSYPTSPI